MDALKSQISAYIPYDQREASDKALILYCMEAFPNILTRENPVCHLTASNWIIDPSHTKALMIYHNIEQTWMWTGGHADGESNLLNVALREAQEETSLEQVRPLTNGIFSLEVLPVPPHIRRGKFVSSHLHLNCGFLLEANETNTIKIKPDENSAIRWMTFEEITQEIKRGNMQPLYQKLINKVREL